MKAKAINKVAGKRVIIPTMKAKAQVSKERKGKKLSEKDNDSTEEDMKIEYFASLSHHPALIYCGDGRNWH